MPKSQAHTSTIGCCQANRPSFLGLKPPLPEWVGLPIRIFKTGRSTDMSASVKKKQYPLDTIITV